MALDCLAVLSVQGQLVSSVAQFTPPSPGLSAQTLASQPGRLTVFPIEVSTDEVAFLIEVVVDGDYRRNKTLAAVLAR